MKAFITRYALTKGIREIEAEVCSSINPNMIVELNTSPPWCFFKGEWFPTKEDAIKDAEQRRLKKIASLKKQIAKLEAMKFS